MKKLVFWIPFAGGFFVIPREKNYLNSDFFKHIYMFPIFMLWHMAWVSLPLILAYYNVI
jgi:hypothetical protein